MEVDFGILQLLASKICHDLVSPVGAINNGIELIEDVGGGVAGEAMKLIASSATLANQRLKLFRLAYGRGGSDMGLRLEEVRAVMQASLPANKTTLEWPPTLWPDLWAQRKGAFMLAINLILLCEECLPQGGAIAIKDSDAGLAIGASGRSAHILPECLSALEGKSAHGDITPRTIQSYYTGRLAAHYGFKIAFKAGHDSVEFKMQSA